MSVLLLVNPNATRVTPRRTRLVTELLAAEHKLEVVETSGRGDATGLARAAVRDGFDHVVVLAGDGTLNEAANGLIGSSCALGCLPGGSTNVFARSIGLPDRLASATARVSRAIGSGRERRIGVGSVNGRHFLLHTGIGWDAELVSIVERHAELKRPLGHGLFALAGLRSFFSTYDRRRPHFSVDVPEGDGIEVIPDGYFALVLNSDPYTYVRKRPLVVSPLTNFENRLTLVVVRSMRVRHFLPLAARALAGAGLSPGPRLALRHDLGDLVVRRRCEVPPPAMPHQVDGDLGGDATVLRFRHHPDALTVLIPPSGD